MNPTLRHLIYDYDYAIAAMNEALKQDADITAALATCKKLRGQIEELMPQDYCDPMANNRVEYIK